MWVEAWEQRFGHGLDGAGRRRAGAGAARWPVRCTQGGGSAVGGAEHGHGPVAPTGDNRLLPAPARFPLLLQPSTPTFPSGYPHLCREAPKKNVRTRAARHSGRGSGPRPWCDSPGYPPSGRDPVPHGADSRAQPLISAYPPGVEPDMRALSQGRHRPWPAEDGPAPTSWHLTGGVPDTLTAHDK